MEFLFQDSIPKMVSGEWKPKIAWLTNCPSEVLVHFFKGCKTVLPYNQPLKDQEILFFSLSLVQLA